MPNNTNRTRRVPPLQLGTTSIRQLDTDDAAEVTRYQEFRYRWAVLERQWVSPPDPDARREYDAYDLHSHHFGVFEADRMVGYVRIILPSRLGLQLTNEFGTLLTPGFIEDLNVQKTLEISRLLVADGRETKLQKRHSIALYLYRAIYQWACLNERYQCLAVLELKLLRALSLQGFKLQIIGQPKQYQGGLCYPVIMDLREAAATVSANHPSLAMWFNSQPQLPFPG